MAERIPQSTTIRIPLQAYLSVDHISPATGKTIAITVSKNGAAYGNPSGGATNATEIASGSYYVDLSTTDTGTLGPLFVLGTAATIDNVVTIYNVVKATNGGFTGIPDAVAAAVGGLPTIGVTIPNATAGAAGGIFIAGSNAPTSITGTSNNAGLTLTGNGTGPGLLTTGGATGHGFAIVGGGTSGDGINVTTTVGHGINSAPSGTAKHALLLTGSGNSLGGACDAARLVGGFTGIGLHALGGVNSGEAIKAEATAGNSNGVTILGFGTGHGTLSTSGSGATGDGFQAHSVSTAGSGFSMTGGLLGLSVTSSSGPGINITAGTHGILSNAGNNGDGFSGIGAGTGAGFRAAGHDGIVGTGSANGAIFQSTFAGQGMLIGGTGAFPGIYVQGGGNGVQIQATGTAHHGLVIAGGDVSGDAINLTSVSGHGISSTGGTNGDGFRGVGAGTGVGFRSTATAIGFGGGSIVIKKNTSLAAFMFYMALASDNKSPALGLTILSTVALDGAAFGATANSAVEMTGGWYKIDLAAADLNGDTVALQFTGPGANSTLFSIATQS